MKLILGIGGGIAAYKSAELARLLIQRGASVRAVMTDAAREFITPLTLATLTNQPVVTALFSSASPQETLSSAVEHIAVARENDFLLVAPATADLLAKFAHGIANDFLSTLYLAFTGPVALAPAMNKEMWAHPATRQNVATLRQRGHLIIEPEAGFLACGEVGAGRLADAVHIADAVFAHAHPAQDLAGEHVLITAGPTQEPIDPVRFISNRSSGKMGFALAANAARRGAEVILVAGPVHLPTPEGVTRVDIRTAAEMRAAVFEHLASATIVIKSAAVADYRPARIAGQKMKKAIPQVAIELEPTQDILSELGKRKGSRLLIGFAAETERVAEEGRRKLQAKNCDMIVANRVGLSGTGFESDDNEVILILPGQDIPLPRGPKTEVAARILDRVVALKSQDHGS